MRHLVAESTARTTPRNNINSLFKREEDKCYDYIVATATFDKSTTGVVTLAQDNSNDITFVYGIFSKGLDDPKENYYSIVLEDCNGRIVYNLTNDLCLKFEDGGTKPFSAYIHFDLFEFLSGYYTRKRQNSTTGPQVGVHDSYGKNASAAATPVMPLTSQTLS
ncbi:hypothetical protein C2G38_2033406 [Gigaspora rosea]|uniref:Uncharacterized protein n=1 Tax=Gigaspora rosea TaxID=44941 RepID=A0A397VKY8_9GLOM|nr:hypothetical protein C2G38_2033406 [Gigaspora rosea]